MHKNVHVVLSTTLVVIFLIKLLLLASLLTEREKYLKGKKTKQM